MADQTNIISLNPNSFSSEVYSPQDESLIGSSIEQNQFDTTTDYVEYFIFDLNNNKISPSGNDATFTDFNILDNEIYVNPETDVLNRDIDTGTVNSLYNFYRKWVNSSPQSTYYISEISSDRTEIRLDSNLISKEEIITSVGQFVAYRETDETFPDFYINLGSNILFIANNIKLDTNNTVLIKLYEPLPANITLKTSLWIVEKISAGLAYQVKFENAQLTPRTFPQLAGPNINLPIKGQLNNSTEEISLSNLSSPNSQSEYQINSYFDDPSIQINVDYSDYSNFVNYSSAKNRIENFWYKVSLIESASEQISFQNTLTSNPATSASITPLNTLINETITNFDNYEYYLYFESSSDTYPKVSSTPPYQNESTGSIAAQNWYVAKISSSEDYDRENQNWLQYAAPQFIQDDSANNQYMTFLNMIGHFVDNDIWVYLKDTTNKWDADNRIDAGVSKDLVAQVLRDMGVKLYQNNFSSTDLYSAFLGFTDSGSLFPFPNMTGSLPTPSGYEYVSNFISSSDEAIPLDDINKRIYKRIYHNLPYLLKSKGTVAGLRTLITSYGIPDTILRISEFGGKDKINTNDWDLWKHQYNFQYDTNVDGEISTPWGLDSDWSTPNPQTVQFRFKAPKSGSNAVDNAVTTPQQVLWSLNSTPEIAIGLDYFGDGFTSGSWSGSVPSESFEYANLVFTTDTFGTTSSIYLPFFNGEWWSVMLTKQDKTFTLYAGDKIYNGNDGSQIGFIGSASVIIGSTDWNNATNSYFPSNTRATISGYEAFSGSYQEIRYFDQAISQNVFKDYVMNPQSTEGNGINGSVNQLAFRASLGGELYTGSESIHPKVSGPTGYPTSSFSSNSSFVIRGGGEFTTNREWVFYDSPAVGIKNRNTDKIKRQNLVLPSGDTLSNQKSIQQKSYTTDDYTNNLNLLEVAFSPQNQINDDIISQIGYFNIGDYIGDPRLVSSSVDTYPSLVGLSKEYFDKYTSSYDVYDYIRLIKFFDNSLFKMVKDFVPSRTGLASGIVVKQHILERQKYPTPQPNPTTTIAIAHTTGSTSGPSYQQIPENKKDLTITGSIGSTPALLDGARYYEASTDFESNPIVTVEGGAGGSVNEFNVPVGFLRAVDTGMPSTTLSTTPTTLFKNGTIVNGTISNNGVAISPKGIIENTGKFTIDSNYTFKGDINVEVKNSTTQRTMVLELVEDNNGIVSSIQKLVPITTGATYTSLTLTNCIFEAGKTYYFQLKTTTGTTNITGVTRVNFVQQDAPLIFRSGQMYSEVIKTPLGDVTETISNSHEFYDGEFSGSAILVTDGELNTECNDIKKADTSNITFDIEFSSFNPDGQNDFPTSIQLPFTGGSPSFTSAAQTLPSGDLNVWWNSTRVIENLGAPGKKYTDTFKINWIAISKTSKNGIDLTTSIPNATELTLLTSALNPTITSGGTLSTTSTTLKLNVISIKEYANSYLIAVSSDAVITLVNNVPPGDPVPVPNPVVIATQNDTLSVLNPYIEGNFANSDCNPLNNNATDITPSTVYYDVDYANNPNVAVNFGTIMSGSAPKAKIQDYNYHARRSIIPRYSGSKNTVSEFNTGNGFNAQVGAGTYIAYYSQLNNTTIGSPATYYATALPTHLIDPAGEILQVTNNENIVEILKQNFTVYNGDKESYSFSVSGSVTNTLQNPYIEVLGDQVRIRSTRTTSAYNEDFNGGFIYPKGLPLTSANKNLERAEQIMKEARII